MRKLVIFVNLFGIVDATLVDTDKTGVDEVIRSLLRARGDALFCRVIDDGEELFGLIDKFSEMRNESDKLGVIGRAVSINRAISAEQFISWHRLYPQMLGLENYCKVAADEPEEDNVIVVRFLNEHGQLVSKKFDSDSAHQCVQFVQNVKRSKRITLVSCTKGTLKYGCI